MTRQEFTIYSQILTPTPQPTLTHSFSLHVLYMYPSVHLSIILFIILFFSLVHSIFLSFLIHLLMSPVISIFSMSSVLPLPFFSFSPLLF